MLKKKLLKKFHQMLLLLYSKKITEFFIPKQEEGIGQWLAEEGISAGFPSRAEGFKEVLISLNR